MNSIIFGKKLGMGEAYIGDNRVAVTKIQLMPMTVSQLKSIEKDGYAAAQVAFGEPTKRMSKAFLGHIKSSKAVAKMTREIALDNVEIGAVISPADVVSVGTVVNVQGTSKGKGFAGVMKRWNFAGGPRTHGQSDRGRAPGSIGQGTTPGRVHKGKHMAGRMGSDTKTVKNSAVVYFDPSTGVVWVTGPVAGSISSLVRLTVTGKKELESITYDSAKLKTTPVVEESTTVASEPETVESPVAETVTEGETK